MEQQLAESPPVDTLLQIYFQAKQWWSPPVRAELATDVMPEEVWECPFPDQTE